MTFQSSTRTKSSAIFTVVQLTYADGRTATVETVPTGIQAETTRSAVKAHLDARSDVKTYEIL